MAIWKKEYNSFEDFENDDRCKGAWELVAVVNKPNGVCADLITECKNWQTAVRRFFKALENDHRFDGWMEGIIESIENGYWKDKEAYWNAETQRNEYTGGYFWEVEPNEDYYYICLNVPKCQYE